MTKSYSKNLYTRTQPLPPSSQTPSSVEGKSGEEVPEIAELQESPKRLQRQPVEDVSRCVLVCDTNSQQLRGYRQASLALTRSERVTFRQEKHGGGMQLKKVIYNGTYPIDDPLSSRFDEGSGMELVHHREDDNDDEEDEKESFSIRDLIEDESIDINYSRMKLEFQRSCTEFETFLKKREMKEKQKKFWLTFDVDT